MGMYDLPRRKKNEINTKSLPLHQCQWIPCKSFTDLCNHYYKMHPLVVLELMNGTSVPTIADKIGCYRQVLEKLWHRSKKFKVDIDNAKQYYKNNVKGASLL
jgi:hypothetical protein